MFGHEGQDQRGDLVVFLIEGEMAGIQQVDLRVRQVGAERRRTRRDEGRIVRAPGHQGRRLMLPEPCLPDGVSGDIGPVVVEQRRLDLALAGLGQMRDFVRPGVGIVALRV